MGQITLGHSAFLALGAYASALVCLKLGAPVLVGWLAAIFITGILGLFIGFVALRTARGLTFSIITYGFSLLAWLILGGSYYFTGGWQGLTGIPAPTVNIPGILELSFKSNFSYYYLALIVLIVVIYLLVWLTRTKLGRALTALRENENLAKSMGINAFQNYLIAFTISTMLAGLAGALYCHFLRIITPELASLNYVFMMFIMLIVGGKGTIPGVILGSVIFVIVPEVTGFMGEIRPILLGIVFLVCIVFMPNGIYPALSHLFKRSTWLRSSDKVISKH
jgi:branched-chain amino acid transport system permease protein